MQQSQIADLHYLLQSNVSSQFPLNPTFIANTFPNPIHQLYITPQMEELHPTSNGDEAEEQQESVINERKQRRMLSNRESARRSRMRKQRHLDELWSQLVGLRRDHHQLVHKLNHAAETHDRLLHENAYLKEETSELRQMLTHMQLGSPNLPSFSI